MDDIIIIIIIIIISHFYKLKMEAAINHIYTSRAFVDHK